MNLKYYSEKIHILTTLPQKSMTQKLFNADNDKNYKSVQNNIAEP